MRSLKIVPWRLDVAFGKGKAGCTGYACTTCPFNSKSDPDLFGGSIADEPDAGICTNESCFRAKQEICEKDLEKFVDKAAKEVKREDVPVTETSLSHLVPPHVKPSTAVRKACDALVRIPMPGAVESLNASVAAGVLLFEAVRQRAIAAESGTD